MRVADAAMRECWDIRIMILCYFWRKVEIEGGSGSDNGGVVVVVVVVVCAKIDIRN